MDQCTTGREREKRDASESKRTMGEMRGHARCRHRHQHQPSDSDLRTLIVSHSFAFRLFSFAWLLSSHLVFFSLLLRCIGALLRYDTIQDARVRRNVRRTYRTAHDTIDDRRASTRLVFSITAPSSVSLLTQRDVMRRGAANTNTNTISSLNLDMTEHNGHDSETRRFQVFSPEIHFRSSREARGFRRPTR